MATFINIAIQQGGRKSTLAFVVAATLAIKYRLRTAVLDCEYQLNAPGMSQLYQLDRSVKYPYSVFPCTLDSAKEYMDFHEWRNDYDVIFFNLPGYARAEGEILKLLAKCDAVIIVLVSGQLDRAFTTEFVTNLERTKKELRMTQQPWEFSFEYVGLQVGGNLELIEYASSQGISCLDAGLSSHSPYLLSSTLPRVLTPDFHNEADDINNGSTEINLLCEELKQRLALLDYSIDCN